jgi:hypothetical protein
LTGKKFVSLSISSRVKRLLHESDPFNSILEVNMKFVCLGYYDETQWNQLSEAEQSALMENCFAYDDELRRGGHILGGEALQSIQNTATLRYRNGRVVVTDGPFAETREQIGGILMLEARDLNHAIQLMSHHPGVRTGPFEIRPVDEAINAQFAARNERFQKSQL